MIHLPIDQAPAFAFPPRCQYAEPEAGQRCTETAETWLVGPDGRAIMVMCEPHAGACLTEYAAACAEFPELAGWTGVAVEVQS